MQTVLVVLLALSCVFSLGWAARERCRPTRCLRAHTRELRRRITDFALLDLGIICQESWSLAKCLLANNCEGYAETLIQKIESDFRKIGYPCYILSNAPATPVTPVGTFVQCLNTFIDSVNLAQGPDMICPAVEDFFTCAALLPREDAEAFIQGLDSKILHQEITELCLSPTPEPEVTCGAMKDYCESDFENSLAAPFKNRDDACSVVITAYSCLLKLNCSGSYDVDDLVNGYEVVLADQTGFVCDANADGTTPITTTTTTPATPSGTGGSCIQNCNGLANGNYQSCLGCNVYASCNAGYLTDNRPCPPGLSWDDNKKYCDYSTGTCFDG